MHIIDLNGNVLAITNLQLALMQADDYRHYELSSPEAFEYNRKQMAYWEDVYWKLLKIAEAQ